MLLSNTKRVLRGRDITLFICTLMVGKLLWQTRARAMF